MDPVIDIEALLQPIPGEKRGGVSMARSAEFDSIQAARAGRAVDPTKDDGSNEPRWTEVLDSCSELLTRRTKDIQLVSWLTEAMMRLHGLPGICAGFDLMRRLIDEYWPDLFPEDVEARANRVELLDKYVTPWLNGMPIVSTGDGSLNLGAYTLAQDKGDEEKQKEFDAAVNATPGSFYVNLIAEVTAYQTAYKALLEAMIGQFKKDVPSTKGLRSSLDALVRITTVIGKIKKIVPASAVGTVEVQEPNASQSNASSNDRGQSGVGSREAALRKLAEVAQYFRANEPHSPIALLVERAARWGALPLEQWLKEVVKDTATLEGLYELLGVKPSENQEDAEGRDGDGV